MFERRGLGTSLLVFERRELGTSLSTSLSTGDISGGLVPRL